jgi:hypothetical protein
MLIKFFSDIWKVENRVVRMALVIGATAGLMAFGAIIASQIGYLAKTTGKHIAFSAIAVLIAISFMLQSYSNHINAQRRRERIERVERQVEEHPERPQLAWDLARTKLESYLDRNLSQVRSIYWLTSFVLVGGFGLIAFGIYQAMIDPTKLPISLVASASGILVSFIGGSFLLIYRSILDQSKGYVRVLERINAVGMAVQVIASIPDVDSSLKNQTTADLARQLLRLYATAPSDFRESETGRVADDRSD